MLVAGEGYHARVQQRALAQAPPSDNGPDNPGAGYKYSVRAHRLHEVSDPANRPAHGLQGHRHYRTILRLLLHSRDSDSGVDEVQKGAHGRNGGHVRTRGACSGDQGHPGLWHSECLPGPDTEGSWGSANQAESFHHCKSRASYIVRASSPDVGRCLQRTNPGAPRPALKVRG